MKKIKLNIVRNSILVFSLAFGLQACKNDKKSNDSQNITTENSELNEVKMSSSKEENILEAYLSLSNALIASDAAKAQKKAEEVAKAYNNEENDIVQLAITISEVEDLEEQRTLFYQLSQKMEGFITKNLETGKVYKQYCPMAFNDTGAYWFSTSKEILNPYFGDAMLHCGSIDKTIE